MVMVRKYQVFDNWFIAAGNESFMPISIRQSEIANEIASRASYKLCTSWLMSLKKVKKE